MGGNRDDKVYAQGASITAEDKKPLHLNADKTTLWLTDEYVKRLMPASVSKYKKVVMLKHDEKAPGDIPDDAIYMKYSSLGAVTVNRGTKEQYHRYDVYWSENGAIKTRNGQINGSLDLYKKLPSPGKTSSDKNLIQGIVENQSLKCTEKFELKVLPPADISQLGILSENELKNKNINHIIIPVCPVSDQPGSKHWHAVYIHREKDDKLKVEIFDSLGKAHAEPVKAAVATTLGLANVTTTEPKHPQRNGYSCGDYVIARAHQIAGKLGLAHDANLVKTLVESPKELRAAMIDKSAGIHKPATFEKFRQEVLNRHTEVERSGQEYDFYKDKSTIQDELNKDVTKSTYSVSDDKVIIIDKKKQEELDHELAQKLQEQENRYKPK